jgi:predicted transport protein
MKRDDVDWSQSRILFVSPHFTENQIQSTNFRDLAIELWQVKRFSNQSLLINQIKKSNHAESIKPLTKQNEELKQVTSEIIVYSEQDHLKNADEAIKELYEKLKNALLNLNPNFEIKPSKVYIAFKLGKNIVDLLPQKKSLKIWLNAKFGTLQDGKAIARNVANVGHLGNGDYEIIMQDDSELEYILSLIKQIL